MRWVLGNTAAGSALPVRAQRGREQDARESYREAQGPVTVPLTLGY